MNTPRRRSSRPSEGGSKEKAEAAANDDQPKNAKHPRKWRRSPNHDEGNKNKTLNNKKQGASRSYYEKHEEGGTGGDGKPPEK